MLQSNSRIRLAAKLIILTGLGATAASPAHADWLAKLRIVSGAKDSATTVQGTVSAQGDRQRLDFTKEGATKSHYSAIIDFARSKAWSLFHERKLAIVSDLSGVRMQLPYCGTKGIEACLKKNGFKKTGSETFNAQPCDTYETTRELLGKMVHTKLWHPARLKEVLALRAVATFPDGSHSELVLSDVRTKPLASAIFKVPKAYKVSEDMAELVEQIQAERKKK